MRRAGSAECCCTTPRRTPTRLEKCTTRIGPEAWRAAGRRSSCWQHGLSHTHYLHDLHARRRGGICGLDNISFFPHPSARLPLPPPLCPCPLHGHESWPDARVSKSLSSRRPRACCVILSSLDDESRRQRLPAQDRTPPARRPQERERERERETSIKTENFWCMNETGGGWLDLYETSQKTTGWSRTGRRRGNASGRAGEGRRVALFYY